MALQLFLSIPAFLWIVLSYLLTGDVIAGLLKYKNDSFAEGLLIKVGLGFGAIGNLIMVLNFLHLASPSMILLSLFIVSVICFFFSISRLKKSSFCFIDLLNDKLLLPFSVLIFLLSLYAARSFLPPSGFDALMYHLSSAQLYLQNHGFFHVFFNPQSDFPMLTEMNYMIGLAMGNDIICRQIDLMMGIVCCGTLFLNCRICSLSNRQILTACIIFLTMPPVISSMCSCDVDLSMAAWICLSVSAARKAIMNNSLGAIIVSAIFAGMAMETKIFGVFILPVLFGTFLLLKNYQWKRFSVLMIVPLLMALPWYIKSLLNRGTFLSISKSLLWDQGLGKPMGLSIENPVLYSLINGVVRFAVAPWTFSIMPSQHQQDMLGPLFISILPLAFLVRLNWEEKYLSFAAIVYLFMTLLMEMLFIPGGASVRYLLMVPLFLIPVCLHIHSKLRTHYPKVHTLLSILITVQILCGAVLLVKRYHKDWIAILMNKSRDEYYQSILPQYPAIRFINESKDHNPVMTIYNYDNYLLKKPYISAPGKYHSREQLLDDLRRYSIGYIYANDVFDTLSNRNAFPELENKQVVFCKNGFYVFKIQSTD